MKRKLYILGLLLVMVLVLPAQQTPFYSQFVLNNYMLNPAYAGTNIGLEAVAGSRVQWAGFEQAPVTNFASVTYGHRKNFSYKGKHGFGFSAEDDRRGAFSSKTTYISYAYHIRIFTGMNLAAGIAAGVRQMALNSAMYDKDDPAFNFQKSFFLIYPDFVPGMRFYTKKLFVDVSIRQLYKNTIQQGPYHLGYNGSKLAPTLICMVKRKFLVGNNTWMLVPAANMQATLKNAPFIQGNFMAFYDKKIGVGASVNGSAFASAILQVRILKNTIVGFAYDYSINRLRAAAANSFEIMMVFTPGSTDERQDYSRRVANCPDFAF
ncbi:MAG TPA: PorP/SprF family type IX secretion system membrane protein [Bacteroidia bacterium]|nr:PorP/SprF family type IX secretion system membrane protein [Bacteroidia bacterium]